jgi:hypothetical protein
MLYSLSLAKSAPDSHGLICVTLGSIRELQTNGDQYSNIYTRPS